MNTEDIARLRKKLTKRETSEVYSAIISGVLIFIVGYAAAGASGMLALGLWIVFALQALGMVTKAAGWKSIVLNNDEQDFLKKNYRL